MEKLEYVSEKNESIEKIKPKGIIAGNPGIGKTTFVEKHSNVIDVVDFDAQPYRSHPNWPTNYIDLIIDKANETNLLLISSYPEVVKGLTRKGHKVIVVCADENLGEEYRKRYISRGNSPDLADSLVRKSITSNEEQLQRFIGSEVVFLKAGQHLSDIVVTE